MRFVEFTKLDYCTSRVRLSPHAQRAVVIICVAQRVPAVLEMFFSPLNWPQECFRATHLATISSDVNL